MGIERRGLRPAAVLALCAMTGCAGKSPEQVEAERAKANAEWNAQAAYAERTRQAEENRLVQEEIAAHQQRERADQQREDERNAKNAERERLLQMVTRRFPDPAAVNVTNAHWNSANTALCGRVSAPGAAEPVGFVASGNEATIDMGVHREEFLAAVRSTDCSP